MASVSEGAPDRFRQSLRVAFIILAVGVVATTLSQIQVLGLIPLRNLLKNTLHVSREANAAFFFWAGLPWYFKPIAGIVTDAFPLFGTRRRGYILTASLLGVAAWIGLIFTPHQYNSLLYMCIFINVFTVTTSTVVGAFMVEVAQSNSGSGRLTSVRQFFEYACILINGPIGGYMGSIAFAWTAVSCGSALFLIVPVAYFLLRERRVEVDSRELLGNARKQMGKVATATTMWAAVGLMSLFYIAPGISTATFYRQQNLLHLDTQGQGYLVMLGGFGAVTAALVYSRLCRRFNLRGLLMVCLLASTVSNLGYLFYTSFGNAQMIDPLNGFGYVLAELGLMDLAVRATPKGSEGLGFALMMSVRNITLFGSDWLGSAALDHLNVSYNFLVVANSLTTLITVPLVLVLPRILLDFKDSVAPDDPAMPKEVPQT